ncbi:hypothetical protein I6B53_02360 [Schaalia sp. 19OD2882]|uniref:hypothetical protein n=1 Tax=Schaalia sp. 19OD2882 TaxID=2794089 RepID=UPI001C1F1AE7|nr:hypothetical protein [Schaalia sp. 19OD2882]QWW19976.1 hypothetical protein I6B53_02360 [Schaalia sp. 19OD2882]
MGHDMSVHVARRGRAGWARRPVPMVAAAAVVSAALAAGCAGGSPAESSAPGAPSGGTQGGEVAGGGGATGGPAGSNGTFEEIVKAGLAQDIGPFQKEVLERALSSGQISESDWKEVNTRFVACAKSRGAQVEVEFNGAQVSVRVDQASSSQPGKVEDSPSSSRCDGKGGSDEQVTGNAPDGFRPVGVAPAVIECQDRENTWVNAAYARLHATGAQTSDMSIEQQVLACLKQAGTVPESTTLDEFMAQLSKEEDQFGPAGSSDRKTFEACWQTATAPPEIPPSLREIRPSIDEIRPSSDSGRVSTSGVSGGALGLSSGVSDSFENFRIGRR